MKNPGYTSAGISIDQNNPPSSKPPDLEGVPSGRATKVIASEKEPEEESKVKDLVSGLGMEAIPSGVKAEEKWNDALPEDGRVLTSTVKLFVSS